MRVNEGIMGGVGRRKPEGLERKEKEGNVITFKLKHIKNETPLLTIYGYFKKRTQWVKVLATKHNILSLISRLIIEAENQLWQVVL